MDTSTTSGQLTNLSTALDNGDTITKLNSQIKIQDLELLNSSQKSADTINKLNSQIQDLELLNSTQKSIETLLDSMFEGDFGDSTATKADRSQTPKRSHHFIRR